MTSQKAPETRSANYEERGVLLAYAATTNDAAQRSIWTFSGVITKGKGGLVRVSLCLKSEGLMPSWFVLLPADHARYI